MAESNFTNHPLYPGEGAPLFMAAGVVKDALHLAPFEDLDPEVMPVITSGGWTLPEWDGNATSANPVDFVYYPGRQMAGNARGLPSSGIEGMRRLGPTIRRFSDRGIKTIIQVTNLPHETPADVIPILVEAAAELEPTAIEVNLSCPNGLDADGNLHPPLCNNPDASNEVMSLSRARAGAETTLGAKDSPHALSLESGVDAAAVRRLVRAVEPYINFLVGINTIGGQPFPEIACAGGKGGMSGPVVAPIAREWLRIARDELDVNVPILSCGGVDSKNAAYEIPLRLQMGAMLVGGAQDFYRRGKPEQTALDWAHAYAESAS